MVQCPLNSLLTALHLFCDMIIGKESTIAFSAIAKLVTTFFNLEKAERKSNFTLIKSETQAKIDSL